MHEPAETCEQYQILISGYLDGELDSEARQQLDAHVQVCARCRAELDAMRSLVVGTVASLRVEEPPPEVWDDFLGQVYNRLERKLGWVLLSIGAFLIFCYALTLYIVEPWGSYPLKLLLALPFVGLGILFVSVLRQRLKIAKTDRYSREVHH